MNNSDTPIGANGNELKVTRTNDADKLLDKYFETLREEGYGRIDLRALVFDVPEVQLKNKGGDQEEKKNVLGDIINVLASGKRTFELEELARGAGINIKLAELDKVKKKVDRLRTDKAQKRKEEKNSAGGTEKPKDEERSN